MPASPPPYEQGMRNVLAELPAILLADIYSNGPSVEATPSMLQLTLNVRCLGLGAHIDFPEALAVSLLPYLTSGLSTVRLLHDGHPLRNAERKRATAQLASLHQRGILVF